MARHPTRNRAVAGAFLLAMAVAATALLVVVGGWETWFEPTQTLSILFHAAPNVRAGSTVLLAGHPVGRVSDIALKEIACPPDRHVEGGCYVVEVVVTLPRRFKIHQNAYVTIQQALVGQSALINIVDVGYGDPATKPIEGHRKSAFADAATELGIGEREKRNLSSILQNIKDTTDTIKKDLPDIIAKLKTTGENLAEVSGKAKATLGRIDTILDENRKPLKETVANVRDLAVDAKTKAGESLDNLKKATATLNTILDENRENVKQTLANAREMSETGKTFAKKVDADLLPRLKTASESLNAGLADFKVIAGDTKAIIATNKGNLSRTAQNLRETSEHLRALSKEVRRAPWRLFATPDKEEVESLNLYDTARAFAMAATDLESVSDTLQVMLEAKEKGVAVDEEMLKAMAEDLKETYSKYEEAEAALLKEFERIQK